MIVLRRKSASRVWLRNIDGLILVWIYRLFASILDAITVFEPETVIRWHRRDFRAYWRWKSPGHSALGYLCPGEFEQRHHEPVAA